jgi:hypothetical protein
MNTQALRGIKVYDANDQFLGILLDAGYEGLEIRGSVFKIFVPSLNVVTIIEEDIDTGTGDIIRAGGDVYFGDGNCSGSAHISTFAISPHLLYRIGCTEDRPRYFVGMAPRKRHFTISSKLNVKGGCSRWVNSRRFHTKGGYEAVEVQREKIPFNLPVALPLRYE